MNERSLSHGHIVARGPSPGLAFSSKCPDCSVHHLQYLYQHYPTTYLSSHNLEYTTRQPRTSKQKASKFLLNIFKYSTRLTQRIQNANRLLRSSSRAPRRNLHPSLDIYAPHPSSIHSYPPSKSHFPRSLLPRRPVLLSPIRPFSQQTYTTRCTPCIPQQGHRASPVVR
jgi:hypothetical protein